METVSSKAIYVPVNKIVTCLAPQPLQDLVCRLPLPGLLPPNLLECCRALHDALLLPKSMVTPSESIYPIFPVPRRVEQQQRSIWGICLPQTTLIPKYQGLIV